MSVADRLNKLTTDITNAYTSIENKGGTTPANKNTNNLPTAIDSIEVIEQATAEGESLSLTNTKAMPYSDYVVEGKSEQDGEPNPSIPSDIHSVADDVNLLSGLSIYTNSHTISPKLELDTGTYTFSYTGEPSSGIYIRKNDAISGEVLLARYNTTEITFTVAEKGDYYIDLYLSGDWHTKTFTNAQLKKGSTLLPYSPYNQGTVTIKQRGKNLLPFPSNNFPVTSGDNVLTATLNEDGTIQVTGNKTTTGWSTIWFNLPQTITLEPGTYTTQNNFVLQTNKGNKTGTLTLNETATFSQLYFQQYYPGDINIKLLPMVVEGSELGTYEPYQTPHDYTIQTEPLRSLPNGVKDTIEAEQHRKIGRQTGTLTETTTITLSDAKTNGAYMCNIKPSGTLTGKTIELEAGDYEIIYELAEEIIEPLTQNQANTMLDIIKTGSYEGTTNIYTDEDVKSTIGVGYYKKG